MASANKKLTKGRGAKAPRSAFRGKTTPVAKAAKAAKAKAKAKAKPAAKARAKTKVAIPAAPKTPEAPVSRAAVSLGSVTCPSGTLGIFDIALAGYLPREALEPAIIKVRVPADRPLAVTGTRLGHGRFASSWDYVAVELGTGEIRASKKLGDAGVDFARLVCMDLGALDHWQHEDSLDGKADVVFWGRDETLLAKVMVANRYADGYGWMDLPLADAEIKADDAARRKASNKWLLAIDYRPHSHHYQVLAAARASAHGAGTLELAGTRLVMFFTTWGDGVFPIYLDVDGEGQPVRVRIQLATAATDAAMQAVNP